MDLYEVMKTNTASNEKLASATASLPSPNVSFLDISFFFFFFLPRFNCKLITDLDISLLCINMVEIKTNITLQAFGMRTTFCAPNGPY